MEIILIFPYMCSRMLRPESEMPDSATWYVGRCVSVCVCEVPITGQKYICSISPGRNVNEHRYLDELAL